MCKIIKRAVRKMSKHFAMEEVTVTGQHVTRRYEATCTAADYPCRTSGPSGPELRRPLWLTRSWATYPLQLTTSGYDMGCMSVMVSLSVNYFWSRALWAIRIEFSIA